MLGKRDIFDRLHSDPTLEITVNHAYPGVVIAQELVDERFKVVGFKFSAAKDLVVRRWGIHAVIDGRKLVAPWGSICLIATKDVAIIWRSDVPVQDMADQIQRDNDPHNGLRSV
jgi:hypothetical protein